MVRLGSIQASSDWPGGPPPRPGKRSTLSADLPSEEPAPVDRLARRRAQVLTVALRRLDRLQSLLLLGAARSVSLGARPLDEDVRALHRPLRIVLRALGKVRHPALMGVALGWLDQLGLPPSEGLKSGRVSVSSLPRWEQVESLLLRLATGEGRAEVSDALSRGFRDLREALTEALSQLPPVLDVEA